MNRAPTKPDFIDGGGGIAVAAIRWLVDSADFGLGGSETSTKNRIVGARPFREREQSKPARWSLL